MIEPRDTASRASLQEAFASPGDGDSARAPLSPEEKARRHGQSGDVRGDDGDFAGALEEYKKAANLHPTSPARLVKLAEGYAANDLHHKAFELYQRALDHRAQGEDDDVADAYAGLGDLCRTFARSAAAVRSYERAVRSRPHQPFLRWKLAAALSTMGLYERAEGQLLHILDLAPRDAFYRFALAELYRLMGRHHDALERLAEAVERAPRDEYYRLRLGAAFLRVERTAEAVEHFEKAAALAPANPSYQTLLLYAQLRDNRQPEIAVEIDRLELNAYDEDFVNRIQHYSRASP